MKIRENISLKKLTTFRIGGIARYFVSVATVEALVEAVSFACGKKLPFVALGGGSNVLVSDGEINAVVIQNKICGILWKDEKEGVAVVAGAGENWDSFVANAVARGLWGLENLSGIPGTVGAAPVQNIGAYGAEVKEAIEWVEVLDIRNKGSTSPILERLNLQECKFGYRDSVFKKPEGKNLIITRVAFRLKRNGVPNLSYKDVQNYFPRDRKPTLTEIRKAVLEIRSRKFPDLKRFGTAGSFFKNPIISKAQFDKLKKKFPDLPGFPIPERFNLESGKRLNLVKIPLAWIFDNICGLKGYKKGSVGLFEKQPIVLVTTKNASAEDVSEFARAIADCVKEKTGIEIEWEAQYLR